METKCSHGCDGVERPIDTKERDKKPLEGAMASFKEDAVFRAIRTSVLLLLATAPLGRLSAA